MIFGCIFSLILNLFSGYKAQDVCKTLLQVPTNVTPLFPHEFSKTISRDPVLQTGLEPFFVYPDIVDRTQSLTLPESNHPQTIACPGNKNSVLNTNKQVDYVTCINKKLVMQDKKTAFSTISCKKEPEESLLHVQTKCHGEREGVFHVIGWLIDPEWFIPQITICWDPVKETTIYTRHVIYGRFLKKRLTSPGRPTFKVGKLFSKRIIQLYSKTSQLENLRALLGAVSRIPGTGTHYFARGHLAPDADFVLPAEQDSTYFYSNVVPQFQNLNNGNWKSVEHSIRELAEERSNSLIVYTGTLGTLELKNDRGDRMPIYLYPRGELYPVPFVIWKVIHDPQRNEAVVILGLNFVQKDNEVFQSFFSLCDDVCQILKWSSWNSKDWKKGSILCCSWNQFRTRVPKMLNLSNVKLLNN